MIVNEVSVGADADGRRGQFEAGLRDRGCPKMADRGRQN